MYLENVPCPLCNKEMSNHSGNVAKIATVAVYKQCLRKCSTCQVAYSNAQNNPTLIFKNHVHNVPEEVRANLGLVLQNSLNIRNRTSKKRKFGYTTSEDALTWTLFRYAQTSNRLPSIIKYITGTVPTGATDIYFWGVSANNNGFISNTKYQHLVEFLRGIGENKQSLSEPDIIIEDDKSVIIFEVKFNSLNDRQKCSAKWEKYYSKKYFTQSILDKDGLQEYQLIRNWFIGNELAQQSGKSFYLVNLAFTNARQNNFAEFKATIRETNRAHFIYKDGGGLLNQIFQADYPAWMLGWFNTRKPKLSILRPVHRQVSDKI